MHFQYLQKVFKQVLMLARIDSFVLVGEKRQSLINQLYVYKKKKKIQDYCLVVCWPNLKTS